VLESHRLGVKFLPPSVNEPGPKFVVHGNAIQVPLTLAKGLTDRTIKRLLTERSKSQFSSLADFHRCLHHSPE